MTHERIPVEGWQDQRGHVERYEWVNKFHPDIVLDIGHGIGYGAQVLDGYRLYTGWDVVGPDPQFFLPGTSWEHVDLNAGVLMELRYFDTVVCFEVLEHLKDPAGVAGWIARFAGEQIFVSVPVIKTTHRNPHHLHDFTVDDIPPMFPGWRVADEWAQPREYSHVWRFVRE